VSRRKSPALVRSFRHAQNVDEPYRWATEHLWFLEAVFGHFDRDGEWPLVEDVQRALAASSPERAVAVAQLVIDVPSELGTRQVDRVTLTVRGLHRCRGAAPLLDLFVAAMRLAVDAYPGEGPSTLSGATVRAALELDDFTYRKVSTLIFAEPWFFGGGSGNVDGEWERTISVHVLLLQGVDDVGGYLDVVARHRFGPPEVEAPPADVTGPAAALSAPRRWLAKREASNRDLLLIAVLGGLVVGLILLLIS
jgi:hypothetical protein